ncbi:MAG: tetratricopeptide repeat protein [Flavitalea sp.]
MKKIIVLLILFAVTRISLCAQPSASQSAPFDKNKVFEFFQNQQYDEALRYIKGAEVKDSNNIQVLGYIGYAHFLNDQFDKAREYYERILASDSNNVSAIQYLAIINNNKDPATAKPYVNRLIEIQPEKSAHYRTMGDLLRKTNQKDSALNFYSQAYSLDPNDNKNAASLAEILIEYKCYKEADSVLKLSLAIDSLFVPSLKLKIRSAYESKDYQNVIVAGETLIRQDELSVTYLTQLALSHYNLKRYNDCIRVCEFMLENGFTIESIYYYEAKSYANLKQFDKSNELLDICLSTAISNTAEIYFYNRAQNFESLKKYKDAVLQYDTAFYLFKNPLMLYNCGRLYTSKLKNTVAAKIYFLKYLRLAKPVTPEEIGAYEYVRLKYGKKETPRK